MNVSATYQEISTLLKASIGKDITLNYCGKTNTVLAIIYGISLYVTVEAISDDEVEINYQFGQDQQQSVFLKLIQRSAQMIAQEAINSIIHRHMNNPAITVNEDNSLRVMLPEIKDMREVMKVVCLKGILFDEAGVKLDVAIR